MKQLSLLFVFLLFYTATATSTTPFDGKIPIEGGVPGPFPWGSEIDFPWESIEGLWITKEDRTLFEFRVLSIKENGTRIVSITHYSIDPHRGMLTPIAEGQCFSRKDAKIVDCRLIGEHLSYWVFVRTYDNSLKHLEHEPTATILTIRPEDGDPDKDVHFWLRKI